MEDGEKAKTKTQLKKEAKRSDKKAKFDAKMAKMEATKATPTKVSATAKKEFADEAYTLDTPPGSRKEISEFPKAYSARYVEACWYSWWESQGIFRPEFESPLLNDRHKIRNEEKRGKFVIVIPPPNVTGVLHLGHALTNSVEDSITRWHRQRGDETLWVPGCDHAGIATQVVVEKRLARETGKSRHDIGREAFVNEVWKWKQEKGDAIYHQLRALGSSCDWSRARFTMDPSMSHAVAECFIRLHQQGLLYRAERLVNWSCTLRSAISDIEVDKKELKGRTQMKVPGYKKTVEFGILHSFAYPVVLTKEEEEQGIDLHIVVSTTRLETMLGDVAVAVHPDDERYKHLVGRSLRHPFYPDRSMTVIADNYVDKDFGTGAVKITPAHDMNDFEIGKRHNLPMINILDDEGNISLAGPFHGQPRFDVRLALEKDLEKLGLFHGCTENPNMVIPMCSRSKDVLEPRLKPQWFVNCTPLAEKACAAVRSGELRILPTNHEKTWFDWLENIRDWCISRQLWWGHRVPAYLVTKIRGSSGEWTAMNSGEKDRWFSAHSEEEARANAMKALNISNPEDIQLEQDHDVLDTWFSSALFPFSVFQWPDESSSDLSRFYPTSLLETGHDILFFWVARMVMMGLAMTEKLPFHTVYLHAMVRDAHGKKMSKSLGNALDPLDVIDGISLEDLQAKLLEGNLDPAELQRARAAQATDYPQGIPTCGTDALRFGLCTYTSQGRDVNLDVLRVQAHRCFCNKLWQACRYLLLHALEGWQPPQDEAEFDLIQRGDPNIMNKLGHLDIWMLSRISHAVRQCDEGFRSYDLPRATQALHELWMYNFCDVYLEYSKGILKGGNDLEHAELVRRILWLTARTGLLLLHPFMPFVTEELYQRLLHFQKLVDGPSAQRSICVSPYPEPVEWQAWSSESTESLNQLMQDGVLLLIQNIRSFRTANDIPAGKEVKFHLLIQKRSQEDESNASTNESSSQSLVDLFGSPTVGVLLPQMTRCHLLGVIKALPDNIGSVAHLTLPMTLNGGALPVSLLLYTEGVMDTDKLLANVRAKQAKLQPLLKKLQQEMARSDYSTKVPPSVQDTNRDRATELIHLLEQLDRTAESLEGTKSASSQQPISIAYFTLQKLASSKIVTSINLTNDDTLIQAVWKNLKDQLSPQEKALMCQWLCWCETNLLPAIHLADQNGSSKLLEKCLQHIQLFEKHLNGGGDVVIKAVMQWFSQSKKENQALLEQLEKKGFTLPTWKS